MGSGASKPEYTGIDKYPGWVATVITLVIGAVFIGALINSANHGHHGDHHEGEHHEADHGKTESQDAKGEH
ncbi:MAG: hypothetical protein VX278_22560 [Myxococcota bacterium]|nr:hypothetical protein [Myxococcota bacterium]